MFELRLASRAMLETDPGNNNINKLHINVIKVTIVSLNSESHVVFEQATMSFKIVLNK